MSGNRYVARGKRLAARMLGDEMMIMSASTSTLFTLNEVAAAIWEAADGATPLQDIVTNRICNQYDVPVDVAMKDAENLVEQLASHGVLLLSDRPFTPPGIPPKEPR